MATTVSPRPAPCRHCGDTVLVLRTAGRALGGLVRRSEQVRVEHADPAPDGTVDDPVDAGCRRPPVRRGRTPPAR